MSGASRTEFQQHMVEISGGAGIARQSPVVENAEVAELTHGLAVPGLPQQFVRLLPGPRLGQVITLFAYLEGLDAFGCQGAEDPVAGGVPESPP